MQITTQNLDEPTLQALRRQLAAAGKDILEVAVPRDKLETLFLRIVQEAQDQRLATGGALAGGPVAEFLRGEAEPTGRGVVEQLVAAAGSTQPSTPESQPAPPPKAKEPAKSVIETLTEAASPSKPAEQKPTPPPQQPGKGTRQDVLKELLDKKPSSSAEESFSPQTPQQTQQAMREDLLKKKPSPPRQEP